MMPTQFLRHVVACLLVLTATTATLARSDTKTGILKIHVSPKQAYVFVDDKAIRDGSQSIVLDAGKHTVDVRNYGYLPQTQDVEITSGKKTELSVTLRASGEKVAGPFADIELKGHPRADDADQRSGLMRHQLGTSV